MNEQCNVWADVDFGHGPVEIRCTKLGPHQHHNCSVDLITSEEPETDEEVPQNWARRNVFEGFTTIKDLPTGDQRAE